MSVLAIDAGTTGVTALVVTAEGTIAAQLPGVRPALPRPGWVEHAPRRSGRPPRGHPRRAPAVRRDRRPALRGIGITNQRETVLLWDRETLGSPAARSCGRTAVPPASATGSARRHEPRVAELTGLRLDPYFSATKLRWLAEEEPNTWALVESGRYAVGTVDSYLVARMTRGTWHVTDVSNASRTLLFDLETGDWSDELCSLFGVPRDALPDVVPSWGPVATSDPRSFAGLELPIAGIAGDQQSALFGQTCFDEGDSVHLRHRVVHPHQHRVHGGALRRRAAVHRGLAVAVRRDDALEGAIFVTGAAVQWLRDGLQIIGSAAETEAIAGTVADSHGVVFVPALTGMGAPTGTRTRAG